MRKNLNNYIYIFCICVYSLIMILNSTYIDKIIPTISSIYRIIRYLLLFALLFVFVNKKTTKKSLLMIFVIVIIGFSSLKYFTDFDFLLLIMFIICYPKNLDVKYCAKKLAIINFTIISLTILLSVFGFIDNIAIIQRNTLRYSLGFVSPNALSNTLTASLFIYLYSKDKKINLFESIFFILVLYIIFYYTKSRFAFTFGIIDVIIYSLGYKILNNKNIKQIIYILSTYIFPTLFISMIILTTYFSSHTTSFVFKNINSMFTGRLWQMIYFYRLYGFSLFGSQIKTVGKKEALLTGKSWLGIDTSYIHYLLRYGFIFMLFFSILYIKLGKKVKKYDDTYSAIYIILICIMGITENILFLPHYNIALLLIGKVVIQDNSGGIK